MDLEPCRSQESRPAESNVALAVEAASESQPKASAKQGIRGREQHAPRASDSAGDRFGVQLVSLMQGCVEGVAPEYTAQSRFGATGPLRCGEISNKIQRDVVVTSSPTQLQAGWVISSQVDSLMTIERRNDASTLHTKALSMKGDLEQSEIRHQCGQDGEMGHEIRNARAHRH